MPWLPNRSMLAANDLVRISSCRYSRLRRGSTCSIGPDEWLAHPGSVGRAVAPFEALVVDDEADCGRLVMNRNAFALARFVLEFDQARAAAPGFAGEAAPESDLAADVEGVRERRLEADAVLAQPQHGRIRLLDQNLAEVWVRAIVRRPAHVVEVVFLGVCAEFEAGHFFIGQVRHQLPQIVDSAERKTEAAAREPAVAAADLLGLRRVRQRDRRR